MSSNLDSITYNDKIVRYFSWATLLWGVVGMLVGVVIATQLADWRLNLGISWLSFGRLRPLHTNAVIFAFAGNAIFAGIYHSTQRLTKARMFSDRLSWVHFWGWQLIIVGAAISLPLGISTAKEYAELEWPFDIAIAFIWVVFAINFFGTLVKRREKHMYVALWFYMASIIAVAVLHIVNSLAIPVALFKSYSVYAGVQDALVQWWYGHNAVAFFLTTPFLGLMYYYLPKAAERPVYSYRLSIIHFWSLVFIYIWAGPHHLLYTALPEWAQNLGVVFSVMLWMPSWGGMINGLLTLRGAWDRVRVDPVLKFLVGAITFYGMATFEGPLLSIKSVNALSHYTDWTIGHVHSGALGWNGFLTFGMLYWLLPRLYSNKLYSTPMANAHFWLGITGIILYVISMWVAGISQGLMLQGVGADGRLLYPDFVETIAALIPYYWIRVLGGTLYLVGVVIGVYNLIKTATSPEAKAVDEKIQIPSKPFSPDVGEEVINEATNSGSFKEFYKIIHRFLEAKPLTFAFLTLIAILIGGLVEIIPTLTIESAVPSIAGVKPYTPLELRGRDIYIREGCYTCHSQMVRPFLSEHIRYGEYSRAGEFIYDYPFQWGSRRIGPDLHRVGGKYTDLWHYRHFEDPRSVAAKSIMPSYPWLLVNKLETRLVQAKLKAMRKLGVPYSDENVEQALDDLKKQAKEIAERLKSQGGVTDVEDKEVVALIAYMQRLGMDFKKSQEKVQR